MATIGNISIGLSARTAAFEKGMRRGRKVLRGFGRAASRISRRVLTLGGALSGAAVVGGLTIFTKRSFEGIDATAKLSDRIGIATDKLAGLQHAAEITGAGTQILNKGLQYMEKGLGEAALGIGEAKYALDSLGLSVEQLINLPADKKFALIADKMSKLTTTSEKAFVAQKMFGRAGMALINTLNLGSGGLERMQAEADKLGIAFTRIDAAKVELANDAIVRMKASFTGAFNVLAIQLAPYVLDITDRITAFGTEGEGAGVKVSEAFQSVARGVAFVSNGINLLRMGWHGLMATGRRGLQLWTGGLELFLSGLGKVAKALDYVLGTNLAEKIDSAATAVGRLSKAFGDQAAKSEAEVLLAWDRIKARDTEKRVGEWMERAQKRAATAAEKIAKKTAGGGSAAGSIMAAAAGKKTGQFKTGSIYELALGGSGGGAMRPVEIRSRQVAETNALLRQIVRGQQHGVPVAG